MILVASEIHLTNQNTNPVLLYKNVIFNTEPGQSMWSKTYYLIWKFSDTCCKTLVIEMKFCKYVISMFLIIYKWCNYTLLFINNLTQLEGSFLYRVAYFLKCHKEGCIPNLSPRCFKQLYKKCVVWFQNVYFVRWFLTIFLSYSQGSLFLEYIWIIQDCLFFKIVRWV